jgi:hypothetical protein
MTNVIIDIEDMFKRDIGDHVMDEWEVEVMGEHTAITFSTRIATPSARDSNAMQTVSEVVVPDGFDPKGFIRKSERLKFVDDNRVELWDSSSGPKRVAKPNNFKQGDVVEVEATFIAIPIAGSRFRMKPVLRSVTLLDKSYTRVSRDI